MKLTRLEMEYEDGVCGIWTGKDLEKWVTLIDKVVDSYQTRIGKEVDVPLPTKILKKEVSYGKENRDNQ